MFTNDRQDRALEIIKQLGGTPIGEMYSIKYSKKEYRMYVKVQCDKSHVWDAPIASLVSRKAWCPTCKIDNTPDVILVRSVIKEKEGTEIELFLDNGPDGKQCKHYRIRCKNNHEFVKTANALRRGAQWCEECIPKEPTVLDSALKVLGDKGGTITGEPFLEKASVNNPNRVYWINMVCENGHSSTVTARSLTKGTWCQKCPKVRVKKDDSERLVQKFHELKKTVEERGGTLITKEYIGSDEKILVQCKHKHDAFETTAHSVLRGYWCNSCSGKSVREEMVRGIFVEAFGGKKFPNTCKASFMQGMELDGYNEELKLAWEHNGEQHYRQIKRFQPTEAHFLRQLELDRIRKERCDSAGVVLIIVKFDVKMKDLRNHVRQLINEKGFTDLAPAVGAEIQFFNTMINCKSTRTEKYYNELVEIVVGGKKGTIVSKEFISCALMMKFKCNEGHTFEMLPKFVKCGKFCPDCKKDTTIIPEKVFVTDEKRLEEYRENIEFFNNWKFVSADIRHYPSGGNYNMVAYRKCDNPSHPFYEIEHFSLRALRKKGDHNKSGTVHNTEPCPECK